MKGIKEASEGIVDLFKNADDDTFVNLYLEICAFFIDAQSTNKSFPELGVSTVDDILKTFKLNQSRLSNILRGLNKDSLTKREIFTVMCKYITVTALENNFTGKVATIEEAMNTELNNVTQQMVEYNSRAFHVKYSEMKCGECERIQYLQDAI